MLPQVAPGSRRQDHTISSYAAVFSSGMSCLGVILDRKTGFHFFRDHTAMPDATASIASRALRIVTIAKRPSAGTGRRTNNVNQNYCKAEYFCCGG
jgi:hypothetical protein